jgi:hypothetical protein
MKKTSAVILGLLVTAMLLALGGCGKSQGPVAPSTSISDEDNLRAFVEDNPDLFFYDYQDGSQGVENGGEDLALLKDIDPVAFWREITYREKDLDIHVVHDSLLTYAEVTITTYLQGLFHTVTMDSDYTKEIDDTAVRYAYLEKNDSGQADGNGRRHGGWELKKISGWEITSDPCTKVIYSVQITSSSGLVDTTITDVSSLWDVEDLFVFDPGDSITLTVDTGNPDDLVFLHGPHFFLRPFQHIGGGIFQGTWMTNGNPMFSRRPRHATIDVIDRGTVFDDQMPYDSKAWGMVYCVGEGPITDKAE